VLVSIFAAAIGYLSNFLTSLVFIALYLVGLLIVMKVSHRKTKVLEKAYIFNLGLVLENMNRNPGEIVDDQSLLQRGYRLKPGHLG
jgi:hypothetical protein